MSTNNEGHDQKWTTLAAAPPAMNTRLQTHMRGKQRHRLGEGMAAMATAKMTNAQIKYERKILRQITGRLARGHGGNGGDGRRDGQDVELQATIAKRQTQRRLEQIIGKRIWTIDKWRGRQTERHQHNRFLRKSDVLHEKRKDVTNGQFVCTVRPKKAEQQRTRFTVSGDRVNYPGEVATPTADMLVTKLLINSIISTPKAKFMTLDKSNFYLMTPLKRPDFKQIKMSDIPDEIINKYELQQIETEDGSIYKQTNKGMYGLPQVGLNRQG